MGFQKGDTNINRAGRKRGVMNRSTEQAKLAIVRLANKGLDNISEDLDKIRKTDPIEAAKIYLKLLEYIVPKKTSIELSGEIHQKIQQISVIIQDGTQHQHIKDV
jgi:hypothetical protein